ncbi:MAG TPA: DUF4340 domain-containing protein, partial [Elusimicrobiota bacterium]|nr:DUF4340 domain-containing protein [Elusimicrobiota bacterium]
ADPRFELAGPRALRLRAFSGDAQAPDADFRVGKEGSGYDAFFVAREGGAQVFEARGLGRDALDREPGQWADKRVCALAPDSVTSLELRGAAGRLAWVRSGEAWSRDPGGALATDAERAALIDPVLKALSALDAESVAPAGEETAPELEVEARVAGAQARVLRLSIGPADAEQLRPVRRDREPYVFRTGKRKLEPFFAARAADAVKAPARSPSKRGR